MTEFTASNGLIVATDEDGDLRIFDGENTTVDYLDRRDIQALREFFSIRNDETPFKYGDFWVFPVPDSDIPGHEEVIVVNGRSSWVITGRVYVYGEPAEEAAKAYYDAHSRSPAWHSAKPGEVWDVTVDDIPASVAVVSDAESGLTFRLSNGSTFYCNSVRITDATLILRAKGNNAEYRAHVNTETEARERRQLERLKAKYE